MSITRREALFKMAALGAAGQLARASTRAPAVTPSPAAFDLAPRQRLLMDFGWRFHLGDSNDVDGDFEFGANQGPYARQGLGADSTASSGFTDIPWGQAHFDDSGL